MAIPTFIVVTEDPPATVLVGEVITFAGILGSATEGLAGKPIDFYVDGVLVASVTTDQWGGWLFERSFPEEGTHSMYVEFPGDETYDPSSTDVYEVSVIYQPEIETAIDMVGVPPPDVGVGEPFYIYGFLKEVLPPPSEGLGLLDKTVELYVDGAKVRMERTGSVVDGVGRGRWRFATPAPQTLGAHTVEVKFPGDAVHYPSSSGVLWFNARESEMVPTIKNITVPTKVAPWERWGGYFHLCNCGTSAGNVRAVIQGDVDGETPIITMKPGDSQTIAVGGVGPARFTIRTGV